MDFEYSNEEILLKDSVDKIVERHCQFDQRNFHMNSPGGWSSENWNIYGESGLLGLPFPQRYGGFEGGAIETMIVMEAFGRALALEPYFATVILAGGILQRAGSAGLCATLLPEIAAGRLLMAFAHAEPQARYCLSDVVTTARKEAGQWVLRGTKSAVLHGNCADKLIVSARIDGERRDKQGLALFLVQADAAGIVRRAYPTHDGLRAADIQLDDVRVAPENLIGTAGDAFASIEATIETATVAGLAEMIGAIDATYALTLEYLKTRNQFGRPIGEFQALQHRMADMMVEREMARSMMLYATMMLSDPDSAARKDAVSSAKFQVGRAARFISQQSIQLHGGIGMTSEYALGHYFKRLAVLNMQFGDPDHHLGLLADAGADRQRRN